ncbi:PAS domain S-box-containing protein/diguanylate cyclase (GGDEF) domain-containing protein [Marinobacter mobilis]|uniref:PAS domain S-box-containing protein/diguanylate cyclase (GGDEF) domain-containing protein n=2 Tax=Marinobacter mobilis TaxID=488533 RepID=A0A1H2UC62_9GAMM|nr:PAS domain S-box-containing protein/diguanylate cyclase (GGDEF) domain-containing protein [Marinobacter mobilis]
MVKWQCGAHQGNGWGHDMRMTRHKRILSNAEQVWKAVQKPTDLDSQHHTLAWLLETACFILLALCSLLYANNDQTYPFAWLPTGLAVGLLLLRGRKALPGVMAGSLGAALVPAYLSAGNVSDGLLQFINATVFTLLPALITWLTYRQARRRQLPLLRYRDFLWFLGALTLASFATALPYTILLTWSASQAFTPQATLLHLWLSCILGTLLVAPVVMSGHPRHLTRHFKHVSFEGLLWLSSLMFVLLIASNSPMQGLYLIFPITIWAATRFGVAEAMVCITVAGATALFFAIQSGESGESASSLLVAEALIAMITAVSCYVRILLWDRDMIENSLEDIVEQRTRELQLTNFELKDEIFVRQQAEKSFQRSSRHYRALFETASNPIVVVDEQVTVRQWNSASEKLFGYSRDEAIGRNLANTFIKPEHRDELAWKILKLFSVGVSQDTLETQVQGFNGDTYHILWNLSLLPGYDESQRRVIMIGQDITEIRHSQSQLHYLAHYDVLTDTANRRLFEDRCKQAISSALRHHRNCALICLDVDHFKRINDTLGHDAGDVLLKEIANRLRSCVRQEDTIGRLGGDEFAVLLNQVSGADGCEKVARNILDVLVQPISIPAGEIVVTSSIGIALAPDDADNYEQLLKCADMAMYRAKKAGRNNIQFFSEDMNREMLRQITLEQELREGIARGELDLYYQPVLDARSGRIDGLEALLRWRHPSRGLLSPREFLEIAEQTGQLQILGEWICQNACLQARAIQAMSSKPVSVRINLSSRQYNHPQLADQFAQTIRESKLDPSLLLLEIDERILSDHQADTANTLKRLKEIGVGLVLDRFGSGLSSLKLLRDLPFDQVKIDQHLLHHAPHDENTRAIIHTLVNLARQLSLTVAATGVESADQDSFLRSAGCHLLQGHRYCKPVASAQLPELLHRVNGGEPLLPENPFDFPLTTRPSLTGKE